MKKELKFLILDDDADSRFLAQHALKRAFPGCRIVEAITSDEAVAQASKVHPDGIITDHHLGTQDGVSLMTQLRAAGTHCPVIMITASSDPAVHRRAYDAGAAHVFAGEDRDFVGFFRTQLAK